MASDAQWPAIGEETLPWRSGDEYRLASRAEQRRHRGPYQAAIPPAIVDETLTLPGEVDAAAHDASTEVARFDAELGAELAPFGAVLLRTESAASSQIENLTASARAIAEAELGDRSRRNATEIVANTRAMDAAIRLADRLDGDTILEMHRALMGTADPDIAGRWRDQQVWIGGGSVGPHRAMFVPPHHSRVPDGIKDLIAFIDRDDIPVLAHTAVVHAQFETIHPFPDGNGRTGRALLHAMLRNKQLTRNVTVPVSAGLLADTDAYFAALDTYRAGNPAAIVTKLADAAFRAVANGRQLVAELHGVRAGWTDHVTARRDAAVWRIADLLIRHPVVNAAMLADELGIAAPNVYRSVRPLEDAGILVSSANRQRDRVWRAPQVLTALDAFAVRAGRRTLATG